MNEKRMVYLIRHGTPYAADEAVRCLGRSDPPLSDTGRQQVGKLAEWFQDRPLTAVYTSPLRRCLETAQAITDASALPSPIVRTDLQEADAGLWDGLTFAEIRKTYPLEYEQRGQDPARIPPPGGESLVTAGKRFSRCMDDLLKNSQGDIAVVAHAGVIRAYMCGLLSLDPDRLFSLPQPYGGISILRMDADGIVPEETGIKPECFLDRDEIRKLYRRFDTPEHIRAHMEAVASFLEELLPALPDAYDRDRLIKAALVHDIVRTRPHHAEEAAGILRKEGYPHIASLVKEHHSPVLSAETVLTESELLFYADKCVAGIERVSIEERFARSREKCKTPEALENHRRLWEKACLIEQKIRKNRLY